MAKVKRIEVELKGRIVRIMPHMLEDSIRFGASQIRRTVKETPKELITIPASVPKELIKNPLPEMKEVVKEPEVSAKKITRTKSKVK